MVPSRIPVVNDQYLLLPGQENGPAPRIVIGSSAWRDWLADEQNHSFSFRGRQGTCTVRRERQRHGWYWYVYRKHAGKIQKAYLGKNEEVTPERLNEVVAQLMARDADELRERVETRPVEYTEGRAAPLPAQLTPLIGREREVAAIDELVRRADVRLVTLVGAGGIGKTRLALQAATELQREFADGVCFVPLAPINDPDLVLPAIAQALGLRESGDWSQLERLYALLATRHMLLVLDNFEQVVAAAPRLVALAEKCPMVKMLVTSRAVLRVRGEHEFQVAPLQLPGAEQLQASEVDLAQYPAVALFLQRAHAIRRDLHVNPANARAIAQICMRLDGLPLAIELAAARIKVLSPQALLGRLERRLPVLNEAARDLPARQQTLSSTLAWSYDLLNSQEQTLFRRLSVFVGGCTLSAAEQVCASKAGEERDAAPFLDGVSSLIDKSLLYQIEQGIAESRLVMLQTVNEYGLERLRESEEEGRIRRAHASYFLELAEEAESWLTSTEQGWWFELLEQERENLRAALQWLLEQRDWMLAARLGYALWRFWWARGHLSEGRGLLERLLDEDVVLPALMRAKTLQAVGILTGMQADLGRSETLCLESLALFEELKEVQGSAISLWMLGLCDQLKSKLTQAQGYLQDALVLFRQINNAWGIVATLSELTLVALDQLEPRQAHIFISEAVLIAREAGDTASLARALERFGLVYYFQGDSMKAQPVLEECVDLTRQVDDRRTRSYALTILAYAATARGDLAAAQPLLQESVQCARVVGDRRAIIWALTGLGLVTFLQQRYTEAQTFFEEALVNLRKLDYDYKTFKALCLEGLAGAVAGQGQAVWAARLWGQAEAIRADDGPPVPPVVHAIHKRILSIMHSRIDEATFDKARSEGRAMTLGQVLLAQELALPTFISSQPRTLAASTPPPPPTPPSHALSHESLTAREREVLKLLANGLTNSQIAEQLTISSLTVNAHIRSIYRKLDVSSRSAATRYALEHGLI